MQLEPVSFENFMGFSDSKKPPAIKEKINVPNIKLDSKSTADIADVLRGIFRNTGLDENLAEVVEAAMEEVAAVPLGENSIIYLEKKEEFESEKESDDQSSRLERDAEEEKENAASVDRDTEEKKEL